MEVRAIYPSLCDSWKLSSVSVKLWLKCSSRRRSKSTTLSKHIDCSSILPWWLYHWEPGISNEIFQGIRVGSNCRSTKVEQRYRGVDQETPPYWRQDPILKVERWIIGSIPKPKSGELHYQQTHSNRGNVVNRLEEISHQKKVIITIIFLTI